MTDKKDGYLTPCAFGYRINLTRGYAIICTEPFESGSYVKLAMARRTCRFSESDMDGCKFFKPQQLTYGSQSGQQNRKK